MTPSQDAREAAVNRLNIHARFVEYPGGEIGFARDIKLAHLRSTSPARAATWEAACDEIFGSPAGEMIEDMRDGLAAIVRSLRATDQLKANGFASDAADIALGLLHDTLPRLAASDTEAMRLLRSEVFAVLRRHDVSEQCFAEVAMVTHAALAKGGAA